MNDLTTTNQNNQQVATASNPFLEYGNTEGGRIVGKLLRFTKFGEFKAGENAEDVPLGTNMVAHTIEFYRGWFKWVDNKPVEQIVGRVADNFKPPSRNELGDLDKTQWDTNDNGTPRDPWQETNILILMDGEGQLYTFSTASKGGIAACKKLMKAYGQRQAMYPDQFPVVELGMDDYDHSNKAYGKIRKPMFEVVAWADRKVIDEVLMGGEFTPPNLQQQEPARLEAKPAPRPAGAAASTRKARF